MRDKCFTNANQVFSGVLRQMRESGLDVTKHKTAIGKGDMDKMYSSGVLGCSSPETLLNKVFVEVSLHFGRRGREGLREMTKDAIVFKIDDFGRHYATVKFNEIG